MRKVLPLTAVLCLALLSLAADQKKEVPEGSSYLFVWAGDADRKASDFLAVIDVNASSKTYGQIVSRTPIGATGTMPHHVEYEFPGNNHLFASGWAAGRSFVFDLSDPRKPRIIAQFAASS